MQVNNSSEHVSRYIDPVTGTSFPRYCLVSLCGSKTKYLAWLNNAGTARYYLYRIMTLAGPRRMEFSNHGANGYCERDLATTGFDGIAGVGSMRRGIPRTGSSNDGTKGDFLRGLRNVWVLDAATRRVCYFTVLLVFFGDHDGGSIRHVLFGTCSGPQGYCSCGVVYGE